MRGLKIAQRAIAIVINESSYRLLLAIYQSQATLDQNAT
jgi:hypothetical protein